MPVPVRVAMFRWDSWISQRKPQRGPAGYLREHLDHSGVRLHTCTGPSPSSVLLRTCVRTITVAHSNLLTTPMPPQPVIGLQRETEAGYTEGRVEIGGDGKNPG